MAGHSGLGHHAPDANEAGKEECMKVEEQLFSIQETAERLQVSKYTIPDWIKMGRLKATRIGRFWRVREHDLEVFITNPPPLQPRTRTAKPTAAAPVVDEEHEWAQARAALVALLQSLLPQGERHYLRDLGITTLPLVQLNAILAQEGYVIEAYEVQDPTRFVDCVGQDGRPEPFGLFEMRRLTREG
jgi:excisionase family DNA binding protein